MSKKILIKGIGNTIPPATAGTTVGRVGTLVVTDDGDLGMYKYKSITSISEALHPISGKKTDSLSINNSISGFYSNDPTRQKVFPHPTEESRFITLTKLRNGSTTYITLTMYKIDDSDDVSQGTVSKILHTNICTTNSNMTTILQAKLIGDTVFIPVYYPTSGDSVAHSLYAVKVGTSTLQSKTLKSWSYNYNSVDRYSLCIDGKQNEDGTFELMYTYHKYFHSSYADTQQDAELAWHNQCQFISYNWTTNVITNKAKHDIATTSNDTFKNMVYDKKHDCYFMMVQERSTVEPKSSISYGSRVFAYDFIKISLNGSTIKVEPQPSSFASNTSSKYNLFINDECTALFIGGNDLFAPQNGEGIPYSNANGIMQFPIVQGRLTEPSMVSDGTLNANETTFFQIGSKLLYGSTFDNHSTYSRQVRYARLDNGLIANNGLLMHNCSYLLTANRYAILFATKAGKYQGIFNVSTSESQGAGVAILFSKDHDKPNNFTGVNYGLIVNDQELLIYGEYTCDDMIKAQFPDGKIIAGQYYSWDGNGKIVMTNSNGKIFGISDSKIFFDI